MIEFNTEHDLTEKSGGPDMTPMIDMVFLLLIFFLLTSIVLRPALEVDLPESETADSEESRGLTITVRESGAVLFEGRETGLNALLSELTAAAQRGPEPVIIFADRSVDFELIVRIMDIARQAGAESLSFIVRDR
ncbi:MAG: ExbD/TolR family protein [Spirochaetota bacterium]